MRSTAEKVAETRKQQKAAATAVVDNDAEGSGWAAEAFFRECVQEAAADETAVEWDDDSWAAAEQLRRRLHAAAVLADSAADAAAPLLTHSSLQVVHKDTSTVTAVCK